MTRESINFWPVSFTPSLSVSLSALLPQWVIIKLSWLASLSLGGLDGLMD